MLIENHFQEELHSISVVKNYKKVLNYKILPPDPATADASRNEEIIFLYM